MNHVVQEDNYGCGVASVANILECTYEEALGLFVDPQNASWKGFFCRDIVSALAQAQKEYTYFYIKPHKRKRIYFENTIVYIKKSKRYPAGHYLTRTNKGWIDPWINFPDLPRHGGLRKKLPGMPIYAIQPISYRS